MNPQNIYDDPEFLARYLTLDRQVRGLDGSAEWPVVRSLLPPLAGRRVVDLGCGLGWFSRWAAEQSARSVVGIDVSTQMIERARAESQDPLIEYRLADLDRLELAADSCDMVFSSLALHYVHDLRRLLAKVSDSMTPGSVLVFSVEHPIYSAPTSQRFETGSAGSQIWPLDNYLVEGERVTDWLVAGVVKQHRSLATYVNTVVDAGLSIDHVVEWGPSAEDVAARPELAVDLHRPWFLIVRASKRVDESAHT